MTCTLWLSSCSSSPDYLLLGLEVFLKSFFVVFAILLIGKIVSSRLSHQSKFHMWSLGFIALALLPLVQWSLAENAVSLINRSAISVMATDALSDAVELSSQSTTQMALNWRLLSILLYFAVATMLLVRLAISVCLALRITKNARPVDSQFTQELLQISCAKTKFPGRVELRYSKDIATPFSIRARIPVIVLPDSAKTWDSDVREDVLTHELSHIKRRDWLIMVGAQIVCALYWPNVLVWALKRKLINAAEFCCDEAVCVSGRNKHEYAENLMFLVIQCNKLKTLPVQWMADKSELPERISEILEDNMKSLLSTRRAKWLLCCLFAVVVSSCAGLNVVSAVDELRSPPEISMDTGVVRPISVSRPPFPENLDSGSQGWVLVEFDIAPTGRVIGDSISVVDSEPANAFDETVIRTVAGYEFAPGVGRSPSLVEDYQYLFRFNLPPERERGSLVTDFEPLNRVVPEYPEIARQQNLEGQVVTVFGVTAEGNVEEAMVLHSSNQIFNESALAAVQQLKFEPRTENGNPVWTGRVRHIIEYTLD